MSNHLGDANKMVSDTPRTDEAYFKKGATMYDLAGEMKRMERELNAANDRIKRLEEAGDKMAELIDGGVFMKYAVQWYEAKEAKL
jgi:predicted  nucleic acid-binding Zn-ribbon protein